MVKLSNGVGPRPFSHLTMKSIIITGANGSLGTATVKKFLDEGYKVIAVDSADNHLGFAKNNPDSTSDG